MRRYDCFQALAPLLTDELVIANLANTSTEWRAVRPSDANLYFVGMGMVTQYATGLALALPDRKVLALEGDGGILLDLSALGTLAQTAPGNLTVAIFDNEGYMSTGRWAAAASLTAGPVDLATLARGSGLKRVHTVRTAAEFREAAEAGLRSGDGPTVVIAKVDAGQAFLGTTAMDAKENKYRFVRHIEASGGKTILRPSAKEHGAPAKAGAALAPVGEEDEFAQVLYDAIRENGIDFVTGLPCSGFAKAQDLCLRDPGITYIGVGNEGTGIGLCAGAWLGGKRPATLMENLGLLVSMNALLRGNLVFGIPTLLVLEYRGDAGDQEFWAEFGEQTEAVLAAARLNHQVVRDLRRLKSAVRDGLQWMAWALRPHALLIGYNLTRPRPSS
jgi:sulfopyruvate decarboxylase TPP-binding subunit